MKTIVLALLFFVAHTISAQNVLQVRGRFLTTPCGDTIVLRGVNKMCIYDANNFGIPIIPEIKKTGSNVLRIVWDMSGTSDNLDRVIQTTIDNAMIPMVEMHDATGAWNAIDGIFDFWMKPDVLAVVKKHSKYILVNIANEPGDFTVTVPQFIAKMNSFVDRFRKEKVNVPLVMDATGYGQDIDVLLNSAQAITDNDPIHNVLYSVHLYWNPKYFADRENLLSSKLETSVTNNIPLIIGEFTGCYPDDPNSTDDIWKVIIEKCTQYKIGYLPWEWGPGNGIYEDGKDPILFPKMDITSDGMFKSIKQGWATEVMLTSQYSIKNTSVTPEYIIRKGECPTTTVYDVEKYSGISISPNPASGQFQIHSAGATTLRIINQFGSTVLQRKFVNEDVIVCTGLTNGTYLVVVETQEQRKILNLVIVH